MPESASVYIWYPHDTALGHASMFIGQHQVGDNFENRATANFAADLPQDEKKSLIEAYFRDYVSWWPKGNLNSGFAPSEHKLTLLEDMQAERQDPSVVYKVSDLNVAKMRAEWEAIKAKRGSTWHETRKNCATIVFRILEAGGALKLMSTPKRIYFSANFYLTPKNIAQICNDLRDQGHATKQKTSKYAPKSAANFRDRLLNWR